ncbi:transcriptional regulator [Plantactinospora sp. BC1]|uniref:transcriptional regulator n=1 Tax=Plantactinospora sp. BC1 TaxID=2108470 RepID=UPI0018FE9C74|nr:transcriptional regulator [Plantactinospora sp. BC1]
MTGQSQSEISEIIKGRQVMAYDVLLRIAEGLSIPRGYMGLASSTDHGEQSSMSAAVTISSWSAKQSLARSAQVVVGDVASNIWTQPLRLESTPVPEQIGLVDVDRLRNIAAGLRALDYQFGGGYCRDAVGAQVRWAQQLLTCKQEDAVKRVLHIALADLHNLAGWTSFDVGLDISAKEHFVRALEQAKHAQEPSLMAKALYCLGRLHLHHHLLPEALKFFQLGQIAAQESGSELAVALLCANEAWTYGLLGDEGQVLKSAGRAEDEFSRAHESKAPTWMTFFTRADLNACIAMAKASLPQAPPRHRQAAIAGFHLSLSMRAEHMARSRAFELTALARLHLMDGDFDHGSAVGHLAVDAAQQVRSSRVLDRLTPLLTEAQRHRHHADVLCLQERIATLREV